MKKLTLASLALSLILGLVAAAPLSAQTFQQYVALGDSLTAGWQSGCLVQRNQLTSYPAILGETLGISDFELPIVQEVGLLGSTGNACLGAVFDDATSSITVAPVSRMGPPLNSQLPRPYNDLGIPGATVADLTTLTQGDPDGTDLQKLSALILRNVPLSPFHDTNAVQQADFLLGGATGDTLVTLWIGNNNVLGAATSGIVIDGVTLVSVADFTASYEAILDNLLPSTRLVGANIPDVTALPFTTTIPPILVNPTTKQPVLTPGGQLIPLLGQGDAANPCVPVAPNAGCPLPAGTLVNLPASSLLAMGVGIPVEAGGTGLPLPHGTIDATGPHPGVTLYPDEVALLQSRTAQYNDAIATALSGATLVDANAIFSEIKAHGYSIGGMTFTTTYVTGGIFSYDGVHPSNIGYMIAANEFIRALNSEGSVVYPSPNFFPALFDPNVPQVGSSPAGQGGAWNYTFETWQNVLSSVAASLGPMQLPTTLGARGPVRPSPRTHVRTRRGDLD